MKPLMRPFKIDFGHMTCSADGQDILNTVHQLFWGIISENIPVKHKQELRGEIIVSLWQAEWELRFSVVPLRLVVNARRHYKIVLSDDEIIHETTMN